MLRRGLLYHSAQVSIGIGLGLLLGWLAVRGLDWGQVRSTIADISIGQLLLAVGVFLLGIYLRAVRWRLLFVGEHIGVNRLFLVQNAGIGLNSVSPIRILSEPTQFGILTLRDHLAGGTVLATMAVERGMDLLVNVVVMGVGMLAFSPLVRFAPYVAMGVATSLVGIALLFAVGLGLVKAPVVRRLPLGQTFRGALAALRSSRRHALAALAASFLYWGLVGASGWFLARGLGMHVAIFFPIVVVQASVLFSTSVPGLPGAFGTFEFAAAFLLGLSGATEEAAFAWAFLVHLVLFVPSVLIAIVILPREGMASVVGVRRVLERWRAARG